MNKQTLKIYSRIEELIKTKHKVLIAIDGNSGSGKTTLANEISKSYDCNIFHMDHFFLTTEQRTKERLNEVGGNVDYERFKKEVMHGLEEEIDFSYQIYNCKLQKFVEKVEVKPRSLNIIEGVYSMHPTLSDYYDLKIFLSINEEEQVKRIYQRNGSLMLQQFLNKWIPLENEYFNKMSIKSKCDIIINTSRL